MTSRSTSPRDLGVPPPARRASRPRLAVGVFFPLLAAGVVFGLLEDRSAMPVLWILGKALQLAIAWPYCAPSGWRRATGLEQRLSKSSAPSGSPRSGWLPFALGLGLLLAAGVTVGGLLLVRQDGLVQTVTGNIVDRLDAFGALSAGSFLLVAIGISWVHSGFEEIYWRGFVHRQMRSRFHPWTARLGSALAFTLHHAVVIAAYSDQHLATVLIASFGVAFAGGSWALQADRDGHLRGAWLSHALADLAVFGWVYSLVFDLGSG